MTDEPTDSPVTQDQDAEPRRVRRRRSFKRSRRSQRAQASLPFTSLRFTPPRLPALGQLLNLIVAIGALGLSVWAMKVADVAGATLTQTQAQLAMNTRGATAGRMAADKLAAQAQADAAQMMAAQDVAQRQATRAASGFSLPPSPSPYMRSSQDDPAGSGGAVSAPYGAEAYAASSYGMAPPGAASAASGTNAMGYTLPQTSPRP